MKLDERDVTRAIIERYTQKLLDCLEVDVAIVGAGPSGLVAAHDLARAGRKVALFERKLTTGGGIWGGGMMFNEIVVQAAGQRVLEAFGVRTEQHGQGCFTADSIEVASALCCSALRVGARLFNSITVEDVILREGRVTGLVINWTPVETARLHVDPLSVAARWIIDATGHDAAVVTMLRDRARVTLATESGTIEGQRSLWADRAEAMTVENTRQVYPGVYVAGMCANTTFGSYRMGPVFGGMLLSGQKAAREILGRLGDER
jgi:thiamine thiazole synthase